MNLFENLQLMKESELIKYSYTGPIYRFNSIYGQIKKPIYTVARTPSKAYANFLAQIKQGNGFDYTAKLDIDKNNIKVVDNIPDEAFDDSIDNIEDIGKPLINDPKYNFEDPDRNDDYIIEDFDVDDTEQEYTSANTSINSSKLPAIFKLINLSPNTINLDFGGGRFDNASEYLATKDVTNLIYDPYNRSSEHNKNVLDTIRKNNGADTATCSNVLNVIKEENARHTVIQNIYNLLKSNGVAYFTVYEGTGKGNEGVTKSGYQLNRKTVDYVDEIKEVFSNVSRKGKLIIANK
nr:MAG TPA: AdoMet dependent proline di-methyltransferase [Caudoviricetes sp.]